MRNIAAYLLAVLGGNSNPDEAAIAKILGAAGIEGDKEKIVKLISELKGKDVYEIIAQGQLKLSAVPTGGGAVSTGAPEKTEAPKEKEKEAPKEKKKKEEEKPPSDEDLVFGLFD